MTNAITRRLRRIAPQLIALAVIIGLVSAISPGFLNITFQNGRLYGSLIDVLVRAAPVALLTIGMTLVIATRGIDLSIGAVIARSEEHTSELQSLMRTSYAVFCLKQK